MLTHLPFDLESGDAESASGSDAASPATLPPADVAALAGGDDQDGDNLPPPRPPPRFESQALSASASSCVTICTVPLARFARASSPAPRSRSNSPVSAALPAAPRRLASPDGGSAMSVS